MSIPATRRPVIGLLLNSLFDGYEVSVWRAMVRAAADVDVDLVCFLGGSLGDGSGRSTLFDLVAPECVDAVVLVSAAVGILRGSGDVAGLAARLSPLPAVSLSEALPGVPSVLVDNAAGIRQVMDHLVLGHGRRRIAFIGGPGHSSEAASRFRAYREALARHGIPFDPGLVVEGDWSAASGLLAARKLLDQRRGSFDAILSSNDLMALPALDELRTRGVDVPGELAVCGFDDVADANRATPPLTTCRQPIDDMARVAVRLALALARGEAVEPVPPLPARLVVRRSCGCAPLTSHLRLRIIEDRSPPDPSAAAARLEAVLPTFGARTGLPGWAFELTAPLSAAAPSRELGFLRALEGLLARGLDALPDPADWFVAVREAISQAASASGQDPVLPALLDAAEAMIGSAAVSAQLTLRMRADEEARILHRLIQPFPLPEEDFVRNLLPALAQLGVGSFFLCRYLGADLRRAALVVQHDPGRVTELDPALGDFPARRLIPGRFTSRRRAHAVLPIQSPDGPIGFAVCEIGRMSASGYEMLMHQISTVLSMSALMVQLRSQQHRLLDTARSAGMAEVAVGTLHNVGNLLNTVSVCAEQIVARADSPAVDGLRRAAELLLAHGADLPAFFANDQRAALLPAYLARASEQLLQDRALAGEEARQLLEKVRVIRDTVRMLQDLAREERDPALREPVDLPALVKEVLASQAGSLARGQVTVQGRIESELPLLLTDRAKIIHILTNLLKNAIEAMRGNGDRARGLQLDLAATGGGVRITVSDSGEGIMPEDLDRIFSYGFTTKVDGHGFGLHTCALYARRLGGSLTVRSAGRGLGATFILELPLEQALPAR